MDLILLNILRCPACKGKFTCHSDKIHLQGHILEGNLICDQCMNHYPIVRGIPRFISMDNYASSFGYQWNLYKYTQVDKYSQVLHSEERFYAETRWTADSMQGNWILDAGCGNGRFIEVCSRNDCQVVGVDISSAIDAAGELFQDRDNVHLVQASLFELPFAEGAFDKCYCIGVIQHTPDPKRAVAALPQLVKPDGEIALTIYERKPWTLLYGKYWLRWLTKRMKQQTLLNTIKLASPILFPLTEILFRLPLVNRVFKFVIPYANYVHLKELSMKQRYEWAVLDTFDMLSPAYDQPLNEYEVRECLSQCEVKSIERLANPGVNVLAIR